MKIKNLFKIVVVLCFLSFSALAQPKVDVSTGVNDALNSVESFLQKVETKFNTAIKKVVEFKEKVVGEFQELKKQVDEYVGEFKERFDEAKELYEEGKQVYEDGKEMYEEGKAIYDTGKDIGSSIELQRKADELKEKMTSRQSVLKEELNAKLKASKKNEQTYQQLYDVAESAEEKSVLERQLSEAKVLSVDLQKNFEDASKEDTIYFEKDEEYAKLKKEYEETSAELNELLAELAEKGKSIGADFASRIAKMSPEDRKSAYSGLIGKIYVGDKEKLDAKTAKKVKNERRKKLIQSSANSFVLMVEHQKQSKKLDEENDKAVADSEKSDSLMTKLQLINEININKNNLLYDNLNTSAGIIELKATTDMLTQDYKLGNPEKDPSQIDLDSYTLKEEDLKEYGLGKAD